jgi:prevent-host-death family protein
MRTISASEAKQKFAAVLDAAQREPVMIRRHDRDVAVVMSVQEFEQTWRQKAIAVPSARGADRRRDASSMSEQLLAEMLSDEESGSV